MVQGGTADVYNVKKKSVNVVIFWFLHSCYGVSTVTERRVVSETVETVEDKQANCVRHAG